MLRSLIFLALLLSVVMGRGSLNRFSLRQAINLPALKKLGILFRNPSLVIPQIHVKKLEELDFVQLKAKGIKYLVFDKDNTLTLAFVDDLHDSVRDAMDRAHTHFPGNIAILSNSVGSSDDRGYRAAAETEKRLKIPVIRHRIKKPACMAEVKDHFAKKRTVKEFRVMDLSDPLTATAVSSKGSESEDGEKEGGKVVLPSEICMVGDRVLTDVVFGNLNGMMSVLVAPLCLKTDHPVSVLIRMFETKLLLPLLVRVLGVRARQREPTKAAAAGG